MGIVKMLTEILYNSVSNISNVNTLSLIRAVFLLVFVWILTQKVIPWLKIVKSRCNAIDQIPGPRCFNAILGNVPLALLKNILYESEESKNLLVNLMQAVSGYTIVYAKEKIFRIWLSWEPMVFLWNPETVEKVLSNNFLLDKSTQYKFLHPWLGTGLLTSTGTKWRTRRKLLVPAFHFKILHDFVPVFNEQGLVLVDKLQQIARRKCHNCTVVDITPIITACTLDIICETIMGVSIGAQGNTNNGYCRSVTEVGECFLERLLQPTYWADQVYYRSLKGFRFNQNLIKLHAFTRKVIRERKAEILNNSSSITFKTSDGEDRRKAFLDLLLDHHINGGEMNEEDIREEVDTFMFEGHDTTAMALSWIIFLLGHSPEFQAKAAAEVDTLFEETEDTAEKNFEKFMLTLDKIKELKYLECCIKEGLRLCPSVPFIGRRLHEEMDINGYKVPEGTIIFVYIYMLHRDPTVFVDPEKFNPDRFLPENSIGRHPFAFVPFSAGPRNCIGQRFATSELKVVLAFLLRHFRFESLEHRDKITTQMEMVFRPKCPIKVRVYERRKHLLQK